MTTDRKIKVFAMSWVAVLLALMLLFNEPERERHVHIEHTVYDFGPDGAIIKIPVITCVTDSAIVGYEGVHAKTTISDFKLGVR